MDNPALPSDKALQAARVHGATARMGWGPQRDIDRDEAVAALHAISADPLVLGHVLGSFIGDEAPAGYAAAAALLRLAGADEAVAEKVAAWQERQQRRLATGG